MKQYHELIDKILTHGELRGDRTGTGTIGIFGHQMRFDLNEGFPLLTTKFTSWKAMAHELVWFLSGNCENTQYLKDNNVKIWDEWASEDFYVGPIYGKQWRKWTAIKQTRNGRIYQVPDIDQVKWLLNEIQNNPNSRRLILTAWNVAEIDQMALPPCHTLCQFYVQNGKLSCHLYQRSGDVFLGVPFNIASYALMTHIFAHLSGLGVGDLVHSFGDAHIYTNHIEKAKLLLDRVDYPLPTVTISPDLMHINQLKYEHLNLRDYKSHPAIKAEVSV